MCFTMIALGVILSFLFVVLFVFLFNFAYIVFDISEWIVDTIADVVEWIFDTFERMWQR